MVDDDKAVRSLLGGLLSAEGYTIDEAANGPAALDQVSRVPPDLVLLDVMMPQTDGWEMLRKIQEQYGAGAIPVVMFSGKVDERGADQAAERGAQGFIGKPFNPNELIAQTKQLLPP